MFKMAAPIQSPAKCEVRSVIRFLNAKGERPAEIHKQIIAVCGNVMNGQNVTKWCRELSEGRIDVHDEKRMRCKKKSCHDSKNSKQTSMTRGNKSRFQDLINIWTMAASISKNEVMYRQFNHSVAFVN